MAGFRTGNPESLRYVFDQYHGGLTYFVLKMVNEKTVAEEIVAEVFVKVWTLRQHFQTLTNVKAFLFISARNASLDYLRKRNTENNRRDEYAQHVTSIDDPTMALDLIETEVLKHYLLEEIDKLPAQCRKIVKMAYFDKLKNHDIAQRLNLTIQTVKNQKYIGLQKLKAALNARLKGLY